MDTEAAAASGRWNLKAVETVVGGWCDQINPDLLTGVQAAAAAERPAVLNRRLAAKQASMAARAADCNATASGPLGRGRSRPGRSPAGRAAVA